MVTVLEVIVLVVDVAVEVDVSVEVTVFVEVWVPLVVDIVVVELSVRVEVEVAVAVTVGVEVVVKELNTSLVVCAAWVAGGLIDCMLLRDSALPWELDEPVWVCTGPWFPPSLTADTGTEASKVTASTIRMQTRII